ncbi:MAG: glycosyltransferase family 4 protein [Polyangiaceae bacterium]
MTARAWHIVTGEYPPVRGGVADYSRSVAAGLAAAGDEVHVWAPAVDAERPHGALTESQGVLVHPLEYGYGLRGLAALAHAVAREPSPKRMLVQYVPQAYGMRGVNLPFCGWIAALRGIEVWVMFHEVAVSPGGLRRWKRTMAAGAMRAMAAILVARADRLFVSIPSWEPMLRAVSLRRPHVTWLPIPSNVPTRGSSANASAVRSRLMLREGGAIVGHFGTYGRLITPLLTQAIREVLTADDRRIALLVGQGSDAFAREFERDPAMAGRVIGTGALDAEDLAEHLMACDALLQPYPDGVSTRRTSAMAGLALGVPIVTNDGYLTETVWRRSGAVELAPAPKDIAPALEGLLRNPESRAALGARGRAIYSELFSLDRTISTLRGEVSPSSAA